MYRKGIKMTKEQKIKKLKNTITKMVNEAVEKKLTSKKRLKEEIDLEDLHDLKQLIKKWTDTQNLDSFKEMFIKENGKITSIGPFKLKTFIDKYAREIMALYPTGDEFLEANRNRTKNIRSYGRQSNEMFDSLFFDSSDGSEIAINPKKSILLK